MVEEKKGPPDNIKPNVEFKINHIIELIESHDINDIQLDLGKQEIVIGNQSDLHKFMIAVGIAEPVLDDNGNQSRYENGVFKIKNLDDRVRILDSSGYGQPYWTHPVRFQIGKEESWQVFANHRVIKPE